MNLARVAHILGTLLLILAGAELLPLVWCLPAESRADAAGFLVGAAVTGALGLGLRGLGRREGEVYRREGVLIVVGAWLLASLVGAIPYLATGAIPHPVDALFESTSGFTTTGASVLLDIEAAGRPVLFWRSFTQWLGGIGIVVLFVALFSELGPGARFLFKLEVPGPKAEMLRPRVQETAAALFRLYLALTVAQIVVMLALGSGLYAAVTHAFSTLSTGGFSPYADSAAHFSPAIQLVILVFLLLAGVNFSLYYLGLHLRSFGVFRDTELRVYLVLFVLASKVIAASLVASGRDFGGETLLAASFQVASILTTTGFASEDFVQWPSFSREALVLLMIGGGCAGSTAGGAKLVRLVIGWRAALREVRLTFSPNAVVAIVLGREAVPESSVRSVVGLLVLWMTAWAGGAILLAVGEVEIDAAATAAIATLSNVGPGLSAVGPAGNFAFFAPWQKGLMVFLMLLGRLEFFALMALLQRRFWRRA